MPDLDMTWAGDLTVSPTGDLAVVAEPDLGTERVLRRLLTNPGDYIWNPEYGAGLGTFIGKPIDQVGISTLVRQQMRLEPAVAFSPEPIVAVSPGDAGQLYLQIRYADSLTLDAISVSTNVVG